LGLVITITTHNPDGPHRKQADKNMQAPHLDGSPPERVPWPHNV